MNIPVLVVEHLQYGFARQPLIFTNLSLALNAGERLGITGPNGSGKTTLFNILLGFYRPTAGRLRWFGKPAERESDFTGIRGRVGYLFQNPDDQLFCPTVAEEVAFGPFNQGYSRDTVMTIVADTLAMLNLTDFASRVTYHLSEGEKRLVSLAAVLAMKPDVLLLDEPTNGLDEASRTRMLNLLAELPQSMIVVSHDRTFLDALITREFNLGFGATRKDA
ncbi:MAG TPA: ABC transporter ATP-binding protein [Kiritimatiellia bacterium]|nr:ABC transporter ATP-binding protein [Kiritimatiellia bacterium]